MSPLADAQLRPRTANATFPAHPDPDPVELTASHYRGTKPKGHQLQTEGLGFLYGRSGLKDQASLP